MDLCNFIKYCLMDMIFYKIRFFCFPYWKYERLDASISNYGTMREIVCNKTCFKKNLRFLRLRTSLSNSLSNRLVHSGKFYTLYRQFRMYYASLLRANFLTITPTYLVNYKLDSNFLLELKAARIRNYSVVEFDFILFFRGFLFLSMFDVVFTRKKRNKNIYYGSYVKYLSYDKRFHFVWKWLCIFFQSCFFDNKLQDSFISCINYYLFTPKDSNVLSDIKMKAYKMKLLQN